MVKSEREVFDQVLSFFLDMSHQMEYVETVEHTFGKSPLVARIIEKLYIAILDFWVSAVKYYRRKARGGNLH